ncbi:MAG: acetyl-CoA carboxylase biotin carboxyl carrier protein [Pseudomonadota bacterium]
MDIRKIKKIIDLMKKEPQVNEIEIREDKEMVRISQSCLTSRQPAPSHSTPLVQSTTLTQEPTTKHNIENKHTVNSPMVGTFYTAPTPGAKRFFEIGEHVNAGDVICLIEAMKTFNQIEADKTGTLSTCLADNGQPVEYGQPLFVIED